MFVRLVRLWRRIYRNEFTELAVAQIAVAISSTTEEVVSLTLGLLFATVLFLITAMIELLATKKRTISS